MADIGAPQPLESLTRLALQSSTQNRRKLRDSCTGCASSKLKCSKEKPTCTRCSRRGMVCEYAASKRTGRTSHSASKEQTAPPALGTTRPNNTSTSGRQEFQDSFWSPPSHTPVLTPRSTTRPSSEHHVHSGPDIWCAILSPGASAGENVLSPLIPIDTDFDALFDSILDNSDIEAPPQHQANSNAPPPLDAFGGFLVPDQDQFPSQECSAGDGFSFDSLLDNSDIEAPPQHQANSNAPPCQGTFGTSMVSEQDQFPSQDCSADDILAFDSLLDNSDIEAPPQQQTNSNAHPRLDTFGGLMVPDQDQFPSHDLAAGNEPRRCCLTIALEFLTQLFPNAPTACTLPGSQAGTCQLPTIECVISKNKQITEAISNMLDCPCLQDEYVVAIISLVVFKVMAWYAAAAGDRSLTDDGMSWSNHFVAYPEQQNPSSFGEQVVHLPTIIGNYCVDGNDQSRMAAQLVLSELHRVQRLVNLLSKRLEDIRLRNGGLSGSSSGTSSVADSGDVQVGRTSASSLSGPTFYQLEADLRKRLRAVSSETIDILRRE
jgi:hypothetical protein